VLGKRRAEAASRRRTGAGGGIPRGGDGVPVAGGQESGGEVARKLPRDDALLMVCFAGLRDGEALGRRRDRATAELELTGAVVRLI
jgi:hypothetical protein